MQPGDCVVVHSRDKLDKPDILRVDQTDEGRKKDSDRSPSLVLSPPHLSKSNTHSGSYLGDEESQEDADSNLHGRFNFSQCGKNKDSRQGDDSKGWVSSAHNSTVQAAREERERGERKSLSP